MTGSFQGSLLDLADETHPGPLGPNVRRTPLARGAWVDLRPGWMAGAAELFGRLATDVPWRAEKRHKYDRIVDVALPPSFHDEDHAPPAPGRAETKTTLYS